MNDDARTARPTSLDPPPPPADGLRDRTADVLQERAAVIVADAIAIFPFGGPRRLETQYCLRLGDTFVHALVDAVRTGRCDPRSGRLADLVSVASERALDAPQLFDFAYLATRTAIDELALDPSIGATSDAWPRVADAVQHGAFCVLAAWSTRALDAPGEAALIDPLTTLHTRPVFDAALLKECHRTERTERWISVILVDVDDLSAINRDHGYGVGDRVLERLGILLRSFFRQHDWVARYGEDAIAVLLPETSAADAGELAERTRAMVEQRLTFRDHRTDQRASVTVSTSVASARSMHGEPIDAQRLLRDAERALHAARRAGGNRVERVELTLPARLRTAP